MIPELANTTAGEIPHPGVSHNLEEEEEEPHGGWQKSRSARLRLDGWRETAADRQRRRAHRASARSRPRIQPRRGARGWPQGWPAHQPESRTHGGDWPQRRKPWARPGSARIPQRRRVAPVAPVAPVSGQKFLAAARGLVYSAAPILYVARTIHESEDDNGGA